MPFGKHNYPATTCESIGERTVELLQDLAAHCSGDHQMAAIHNEVVIEGQLAVNVLVIPALFWELTLVLGEPIQDIVLELLIFLVNLGMLSRLVGVDC